LRVIADQIAAAPFACVESLTEPPEGDMTYDECRRRWPEMVLWGNINIEAYEQPPDQLRRTILDKLARAGRRGFAFEISEALPRTWQEKIPVILETLNNA
jgi:hypothetical protein